MSPHLALYFGALPSYFGGKRKLAKKIFKALRALVPMEDWWKLTFIDCFLGGGAISMAAKAMGIGHLISNDISPRSQVVIQALLTNNRLKLSTQMMLELQTFGGPNEQRITTTMAGSVFSNRHAQAIDQALSYIQSLTDPTAKAMWLLIVWQLVTEFVAFGTSIGTSNRPFAEVLDGKRSWWELNPKRLTDKSFGKLLLPVWQNVDRRRISINRGVFAGAGQVKAYQLDAFDLIEQVQGDVLYLDPPYPGTLSYENANAILDEVLFGPQMAQTTSMFTQDFDALVNLLSRAKHIPIWMLSLNNKVLGLEELKRVVSQIDPSRNVDGWSMDYKHLAHVSQNQNNQELLVIAKR